MTWNFFAIFLVAVLVAPRLSINLPKSSIILSFSDSAIFLVYLLYGGEAAIFAGVVEMLISCLYFKYKGLDFSDYAIGYSVGMVAISMSLAYALTTKFAGVFGGNADPASTSSLITTLGTFAILQFVFTSFFAATYYALKSGKPFLKIWIEEGSAIAITQFVGAALAAVFYKLLGYSDPAAIGVAIVALGIFFFAYRKTIAEMTESINEAEQAGRERAEADARRAEEAEKYAVELSTLLKIEEDTSRALRKSRQEIEHAAMHDALTGLPNRAYFAEDLRKALAAKAKTGRTESHVIFIDLSRFKKINDSLGHTIGDKVLMIVAKRFLKSVRPTDLVARLGGDEFAIILNGLANVQKAEKVAWKIHQKISQPFSLSGNKINIGINIGIAPCDLEYDTPEDVLRDADIAMHHAKNRGSGVEIFNPELRERFVQLARIESELPFAIERDELAIFYQPIISLTDGSLIGFEALLRWFHRERGFISPGEFIPVAEDTGQIIPITTWLLKRTCAQLAEWQKFSYATRNLMMSVNISGRHMAFQSLLVDVEDAISDARVSPACLKLEITESAAMEDIDQTVRMLSNLKSLGVQLSIDDFGTGYSSLSQLHSLPFDTLKIDRSFVYTVGANGENSEILQTIISLAKNLQMGVIAEGIETENQLALLQNLGCDYGQGFLLSKPLPKEQIDELLYQKSNWFPPTFLGGVDDVGDTVNEELNLPAF
ncbi:MAG: EAL domain-containing protein [Acidobacteria bacterium]|nr:EAL domain-containing protein [Acidobacteriota bacterium]